MATTTDKRVVEMALENSNFERNAKVSMDTLDHLKKKMDFSGETGKSLNLDKVSEGINGLKNGFSALSEIAIGALRRIGEKAVDLGATLAKSITLDPVIDGFKEYELEMNSVKTILTNTKSKGTTIDDVNKALAELNKYADETIYNFGDMTRAIGQFTTAGMGLEDSVAAIKGFSNLAAGNGVDNAALTRAEYQLSQALSSGNMFLMDWRSMENAGMGGELFQKELIEAGKQIHKNEEDYLAMLKRVEDGELAFRQSLNKQDNAYADWINKDVMMTALKNFANDPDLTKAATNVDTFTKLIDTLKEAIGTGWGTSFKKIFGDYEEATKLWTGISDALGGQNGIITQMSDARNAMLQSWKDMGGRDSMIEAGKNAWEALLSVLKPIKEAFQEIFPPMTAQKLLDITNKVKDFTANLKLSSEQQEKVKAIAKGLFSSFEMAGKGIRTVVESLASLGSKVLPLLLNAGSGIGSVISNIKEFFFGDSSLTNASSNIEAMSGVMEKFKQSFTELPSPLQKFHDKIKEVIEGIKEFFEALKDSAVSKWTEGIESGTSTMKNIVQTGFTVAKDAVTGFLGIAGKSTKLNLFDDIKSKSEDASSAVKNSFSEGTIAEITRQFAILEKLGRVKDFAVNVAKGIGEGVKTVFLSIKSMLSNVFKEISGMNLSDIISKLLDLNKLRSGWKWGNIFGEIANHIKSGSDAIKAFSNIMNSLPGTVQKGIDNITNPLKSLGTVIESYKKDAYADILLKIAGSIGIIALSCYGLSRIPADELKKAVIAVGAMMGELLGSLKLFAMITDGKDLGKIAIGIGALTKIALSVYILTSSLKSLANLPILGLAAGLFSMGAMMTGFMVVVMELSKMPITGSLNAKAFAMIMIAASLGQLVKAIKQLADIPVLALISGLGGMAIVMAEMLGFVTIMNKIGSTGINVTSIVALIAIAFSMKKLVKTVEELGSLPLDQLIKGIVGVGALMLEIVGVSKLTDRIKGSPLGLSVSMIAMGVALRTIGKVVADLGGLEWKEIGKGLATMAGSLVIIGGAMYLIPKDTLLIGAGLVVVGAALKVIGSALKGFGGMSWDEISRGLVALAGSLLILAPAMYAMSGSLAGAAAMLVMAAALAIFAPALALLGSLPLPLIGTALLTLAGGFTVIGAAAYVLAPVSPVLLAFAAALAAVGAAVLLAGAGFLAFSTGIATLAAIGAAGIGSIMLLIDQFLARVPEFAAAFGQMFIGICDAIVQNAPKVIEAMHVFVEGMVTGLVQNIPTVVAGIMQLITALLAALAENMPKFIEAGANYLVSFLSGLAQRMPDVMKAAYDVVVNFIKGIAEGIPRFIQAGMEVVIAFIEGMGQGLANNRKRVIDAIHNLMKECFLTVLAFWGIHSPSKLMSDTGQYIPEGFAEGVSSKNDEVYAAFQGMGESGLDGLGFITGAVKTIGGTMFDNFIGGFAKKDEVKESSSELGQSAVDGVSDFEGNMNTEGYDLGKALTDGYGSNVDDIFKVSTEAGHSGLDGLSGFESLYNLEGGELSTQTITGFSALNGDAQVAGTDLGKFMKDGLTDCERPVNTEGKVLGQQMIDGIKDKHDAARTEGKTLGRTVAKGAKANETVHEMKTAGKELVNGLVKGIELNTRKAEEAAKKLADSVAKQTKKALKVSSPSKVMEEIGMYTDEGLANGIKKFSNRVFGSVNDVNEGLIGTFSSVLSTMISAMDDKMDLDPVIRPVLDLSNVEENAGQLNSMLMSDETFKMANANSAAIRASREYNEINNQNLAIDDTGIISAIDKLHNDIADMSVQLSNMQVIMDSGALVGQLFAPMDAAFGSRIQRNLREREA